jgi:hypothetical protein
MLPLILLFLLLRLVKLLKKLQILFIVIYCYIKCYLFQYVILILLPLTMSWTLSHRRKILDLLKVHFVINIFQDIRANDRKQNEIPSHVDWFGKLCSIHKFHASVWGKMRFDDGHIEIGDWDMELSYIAGTGGLMLLGKRSQQLKLVKFKKPSIPICA